jgi:hypothetical protein
MGPSSTLSPFARFRVLAYAGYLASADFSTGRGGFPQLLGASLPSCRRYHPAGAFRRSQRRTVGVAFARR